ncbi:M1 family metallopeptidase [Aporhodopirellula aestuarii]|uniref:M1 family metallopeptidase n=1 Tax=Aporhodopirellula aestuarii TaxID=2950107 RepID=A0ABT0TXT1_9BACT|nr:M1 family metallopeptidase [Aporhodopirellula aestuarii]MCM2369394.1 M1 family metallopeptidase [Aporhodopirellula aestuarii]
MIRFVRLVALVCVLGGSVSAQPLSNPKHSDPRDPFFPIQHWLPTPGVYRTASGAPGPFYWQQRADYEIDVTLNDVDHSIKGECRITYHNVSPDTLTYIWVQLDQNRFRNDSAAITTQTAPSLSGRTPFSSVQTMLAQEAFDGGYKIESVSEIKAGGKSRSRTAEPTPLTYMVADTMMRVDLQTPLAPGESTTIAIAYHYNIIDAKMIRARGGYEHFKEDDNAIYEISQWFPRVAAYTDYTGWQHDQFLGAGEFTLELGDYRVSITVPDDMVVTGTGTLSNPEAVLKKEWIERLDSIHENNKPTFIVTPEEAKANETAKSGKSKGKKRTSSKSSASDATKTWVFTADNVRDFAWAASRKFIWDAMPVKVGDRTVTAMSFYPNEAEPLWSQYSTESIAHTLEVYGRYTFDYPYDVAISVNGPVYGMEYPMICFNGPRPEDDGTYSKATKYGLISVIIHEVGHNFFPMIVNSDERQWTWMDEGLNTFLQYLAEQEWEEDYPSSRGPAEKIVPYMRGGNQRPIMTGSDEILQFGNNGYAKPAAALNILRETVLGRERFDFAFREYCRRWKFKRPTPADFFRTMEDASGTNLDWFWRGWFYSTEHVDIAIDSVELFVIDSGDPDEAHERKRREDDMREETPTDERNHGLRRRIEWQPGLKDFYNSPEYDEDKVEESDRKTYQKFLDRLDEEQRALLQRTTQFYVIKFLNKGGLVMPIPLRVYYADNTQEQMMLPAEIWRKNSKEIKKLLLTEKEIVRLEIDPKREIADTNTANNHWPPKLEPTRFQLFKDEKKKNEMQKARGDEDESDDDSDEEDSDKDSSDKKSTEKETAKNPNGKEAAERGTAPKPSDIGEDAESAKPKPNRKRKPTAKETNEGKAE